MVSTVEAVRNALDNGYTLIDCANALGTHRSSLWKQLKSEDSNFQVFPRYTHNEVCDLIKREVPIYGYARDWGIRFVKAKLSRLGYRVSRNSVRDALEELLPGVLEERFRRCITRRIYDVTEPMQVWHMDSYDKLARWGFRVHGAIDGASHFVVYMKVALNKKASSIYAGYKSAIDKYGHPLMIRSDYAAEHSLVRRNLEQARPGTHCYRTGSSVHNQRIEAFWRHLRVKATQYFKDALHDLSYEEGLLQIEDPLHRFCMVTVFLPLIEEAVHDAILTWNSHKVRAVKERGRERPSHIPKLTFQEAEREARIVLPPPYAEGVNIQTIDDVEDVDTVGYDTWNHNDDMGNFEEHIEDLPDEELRSIRDAAYGSCITFVENAKEKLRLHLLLSLECERCSNAGMRLEEYLDRESAILHLPYDRKWALNTIQRQLSLGRSIA